MRADNTHALTAATRRRAEATRERARQALQALDRAGTPITYTAVATAAGVSRNLLYRDPDLRDQINRLRAPTSGAFRPPAAQRMTQASRDELLATLREEVKELRTETRTLRNRLAVTIGEQRAITTSARVNDM